LSAACAYAFEAGEIELNEFEASAVDQGVLADLCRSGFGLFQIARRADYLCAMRRE